MRVWSWRYLVYHFGIAGPVDVYGRPTVIHNSKRHGGVVWTPLEEFTERAPFSVVWAPANAGQASAAVSRAKGQIGQPFDLWKSNCEDFVNWVVSGTAMSPQRVFALALLSLVSVILGIRAFRPS